MGTFLRLGERLTGGLAVALLVLASMAAGGPSLRADDENPTIPTCPGAVCNNNCAIKPNGFCMPPTTCTNGMGPTCVGCSCLLSAGGCGCG